MGSLIRHRTHRKGNRGSVLILSLWILALLFILGTSLAYRMRMELQLSRAPWDNVRCMQLAKAAADQSASFWQAHASPYTTLNQSWRQNESWFKNHGLFDGSYTILHEGMYGLEDESARLNVNLASADALKRLFGSNGFVVPAIIQWRTTAGDHSSYDSLGYTSRQGPFKSLEELMLVKGMTPEIYEDVKTDLTVYSSDGVNINTASPRVLSALGMPASLVQKILLFRQGSDGIEGTEDDGIFTTVDGIMLLLQKRFSLTDAERSVLAALVQNGQLAVQSDVVRFHLVARLNDTPGFRRFEIVLFARSRASRILYWREMM